MSSLAKPPDRSLFRGLGPAAGGGVVVGRQHRHPVSTDAFAQAAGQPAQVVVVMKPSAVGMSELLHRLLLQPGSHPVTQGAAGGQHVGFVSIFGPGHRRPLSCLPYAARFK